MLLKPGHGRKSIISRGFDRVFGWITAGYVAGVRLAIFASLATLVVFGLLCFAAWRLSSLVPSGFLPDEDQGYVTSNCTE